MKVSVGFSDIPSPLGVLHNVESVKFGSQKQEIIIYFKSIEEAQNQFTIHEGFKTHLSKQIELVETIDNRHFIRINNTHNDIDIFCEEEKIKIPSEEK